MVNIYKDICFVLFVIQTLVELSTTTYIFRGDIDQFSSDIAIKSDINKNCNSSGGYCKCATLETFIYHKDINKGECVKNSEYMSDCQSNWKLKRIEIVRPASKSPVTFTFKMSGYSCFWKRTEYTEYGADYITLPRGINPGSIKVQRVFNKDLEINISKPNELLSMYPGMLLKLRIQCRRFVIGGVILTTTCLLLKIEGQRDFTINPDNPSVSRTLSTKSSTLSSIPSLTLSPTSSMTPSPTPLLLMSSSISPTTRISDMAVTPQTAESLNTNPSTITMTKLSTSLSSTTTIPPDPENGERGGAGNESSDLVLILASTLLMFVLAVVLVGLLLICRRRSKSLSRNIEKGSDDDNNTLPHHATLTKKSQVSSQVYTVPGSQINTTPVYDNVHENAPNHYELEYDYATCDAPAQTISDSTSPQSIYQEIDTLDGVPEPNVNSEDNMYVDESKENPYYHSLEDETSKGNIYEEAQTN